MDKPEWKVQHFLSLAEATVCVNYPASAKSYLGLKNFACRVKGPDGRPKGAFLEHQRLALEGMKAIEITINKELQIPNVYAGDAHRV